MLHISVNIKVTAGAVALLLTVLLRSCGETYWKRPGPGSWTRTTGAAYSNTFNCVWGDAGFAQGGGCVATLAALCSFVRPFLRRVKPPHLPRTGVACADRRLKTHPFSATVPLVGAFSERRVHP